MKSEYQCEKVFNCHDYALFLKNEKVQKQPRVGKVVVTIAAVSLVEID
jgi:hypothetical protein